MARTLLHLWARRWRQPGQRRRRDPFRESNELRGLHTGERKSGQAWANFLRDHREDKREYGGEERLDRDGGNQRVVGGDEKVPTSGNWQFP